MEAGVLGAARAPRPRRWPRVTPRWRGDLGSHRRPSLAGSRENAAAGMGFLGGASSLPQSKLGCQGLRCAYPVGNLVSLLTLGPQPPPGSLRLGGK